MSNPPLLSRLFSESSAREPAFWWLLQAVGVISALTGVAVMLGWLAHWTVVVELVPNLPPMRFITALCFTLNGVSWILMGNRARRGALLLVCIPGAIGLATLLEFVTRRNFGIDELMPWTGRMTPWSAYCFVLLAAAVLSAAAPRQGRRLRRLSLSGLLAGIVAATAALALLGYLLDGEAARAWGVFAGMSVHGATIMLSLAVAFLAHVWRATRESHVDPLRWLPVAGSILSMAVMVLAAALSFRQLAHSVAWRKHSYDVLLSAQALLGYVADTQRGMRGYILTQQSTSLDTYRRAEQLALAEVWRLQRLTGDNREQHARAQGVAEDLAGAVDYSHRLLAAVGRSGLPAAIALESTGEGREVVDRVRRDLQQFTSEESLLLTSRDAAAQSASRNTELLLFLGSGLAALLLMLAHLIAFRENARRRRTEARLRSMSSLQSAILNSANYAITATNVSGVVTMFNATAERWLGYSAEEVVGKATPALWHEPDEVARRAGELTPEGIEARTLDSFGRYVQQSDRYESEWTFRRRDGSVFPGWLSMSTLKDDAGELTGYLGIFDDITERHKQQADLKLSEERFRLAFDNAPIGIALVSTQGRWLKVNRALCDILGYEEAALLHTDFQALTHPDDLQKDLDLRAQVLAGRIFSYQMEKRYFHKRGHEVHALLSVSLVRDRHRNPEYFVTQIEDISARREVDRMKIEFVSIVSHELRTPLTAIRGSLGLIAGGAFGELPDKVAAMVRMAHQNSERLGRLINDILDLQKIEAGKLEIRLGPIPLSEFLQQAVEINRPYGDRHRVQLRLEPPGEALRVRADPDRLMQVVTNLLSNAAKFSPAGGDVLVRCSRRGARALIEVVDHGTGIPEQFRSHIFEKFAQADASQARRFEGTGLGLNISRQLVEAMGGNIGFDTEIGQGTTFHFTLPLASEAPTGEADFDATFGSDSDAA